MLAPPTPTVSCSAPNREAQSVDVVSPDYPDSAAKLNLKVTYAVVAVSLDQEGRVLFTQISKSSGNADLDEAALSAAARSTYQPAIQNCKPVATLIGVREEFDNSPGTPGPTRTPSITLAPKPSFSAPAGWKAEPARDSPHYQMFYAWIHGQSIIAVEGTVNMDTLDDLRAYREKELAKRGGAIKTSRAVTICNGTQDGWLLVYTMNGGRIGYAEQLSHKDDSDYWVVYASKDRIQPNPEVLTSLASLCMP